MLKTRSRKFRLALLCGTLVLSLLALSIPDYQNLSCAVKHLSTVKAVGSFQASVVTIFADDFETDRGWIPNPNFTDTATTAFGAGTGNWEAQFQQARIDFPGITY